MVLLTFFYVAATILLVRLALRQARLTEHSIAMLREAEHNRYRPYVIFDIIWEFSECTAYAVVKNTGVTPAIDVKIGVEPRLHWPNDKKGIDFVEKGIAYLAPNRVISEPFSWSKDFHDSYAPFVFKGSVGYSDPTGTTYLEKFHIDISYTQTMGAIGKPDVPHEIEKIRKALETIASNDFQPLVRVISQRDYKDYKEGEIKRRDAALYQRLEAMAQSTTPPAKQEPKTSG